MTSEQERAWEKLLGMQYSSLYWQYQVSNRLLKLRAIKLILAVLSGAGLTALFLDTPWAVKVVGVVTSIISAYLLSFDLSASVPEAITYQKGYKKLFSAYEKLWIAINAGKLTSEEITERLEILLDEEALLTPENIKYNEKLRTKIYNMLLASKGLTYVN